MTDDRLPSGIPLDLFRSFLMSKGFQFRFVPGGFEKWHRPGKYRPVIIRMYQDPVPQFTVRTALRSMLLEPEDLRAFMEQELK
ncbi:hypothetical protein ACFOTA_09500 [Chitinophaga sp. GCM10012297]|uniref:Type II toxin-antitoxin system HicA family toxin n=1 Tax=Chitinophaga chungangae TaxID=2821488 RepID=A0ABS3YDP5_9BACT|nr:hypothetical protein [Chitinophaga chungangae]MBO9152438.1 hypothetical protein [Chitinophaga chungangae]